MACIPLLDRGRRVGVVCLGETLPKPRDRPDRVDEGCGPNKRGMLAWMDYAEQMTKSHRQEQCPKCGRWHIWIKRAKYRREGAR